MLYPFFAKEYQGIPKTKIMTTRLTGGLSQGYKPKLPASAQRRWLSLCSSLIALDSSLAS